MIQTGAPKGPKATGSPSQRLWAASRPTAWVQLARTLQALPSRLARRVVALPGLHPCPSRLAGHPCAYSSAGDHLSAQLCVPTTAMVSMVGMTTGCTGPADPPESAGAGWKGAGSWSRLLGALGHGHHCGRLRGVGSGTGPSRGRPLAHRAAMDSRRSRSRRVPRGVCCVRRVQEVPVMTVMRFSGAEGRMILEPPGRKGVVHA